jgi:HAD superfamily hydrolase (TIGR01509 family)
MDGVITASNPYHRRAWQAVCRRHGKHVPASKFTKIYGRINAEIVEFLFGRRLTRAEILRYAEEKEALYRAAYRAHAKPVAGLLDLLKKLKAARVPRAVATSAPTANVRMILSRTGARRYFRTVVDSTGIKKGKPHPDIFLRAAHKLGVPPSRCVVFEDSLAGIEAAHRAGMKVVGITTTHSRRELSHADRVIRDFRGLSPESLEALWRP